MKQIRPAGKLIWAISVLFWCSLATGVLAQDELEPGKKTVEPRAEPELAVPGTSHRSSPQGAPKGIESLLQLPAGFLTTSPRSVAGASENEWRRRFKKADSALSEAKSTLAATKRELDGVALGGSSSQWSVAPPGGSGSGGGGAGASTSPLSFRLRQQLRADRERIESTEKAMRELRIEADLAGVPETWRVGDGKATADRRN